MPTTLERPRTAGEPVPGRVLNRIWLGASVVLVLAMLAAAVAFLWPNETSSPPGRFAGDVDEIRHELERTGSPIYVEDGDFFVIEYDVSGPNDPYAEVAHDGLMVLSARSPRMPGSQFIFFCPTSGRFESYPGGSTFNRIGELQPSSPAPHGLWRHPFRVDASGRVLVSVSERVAEPPYGFDSVHELPRGPHCLLPGAGTIP